MHRSVLTFIVMGVSATALPAIAADIGMYRPGTPYSSIIAQAADICEAQCTGDAQCRGWNFVKIKPTARNGVCEFNSQIAAPVASPISVSGENYETPRSVKVHQGKANVIRVGTPPHATTQQRVITNTAPRRRIIREPIPNQVKVQQSAHKTAPVSLNEQQNQQRQGLPPTIHHQKSRPIPSQTHTRAPRFQHNLDDYNSAQPVRHSHIPQNGPYYPQVPKIQPQHSHRIQTNHRPPVLQNTPRRVAQSAQGYNPKRVQQHTIPAQQAARGPYIQQNVRRKQIDSHLSNTATTQQSLFGSLHDDVQVPRSITPSDTKNPNVPIATTQAVPTKPVTTETLFGLAGAPK